LLLHPAGGGGGQRKTKEGKEEMKRRGKTVERGQGAREIQEREDVITCIHGYTQVELAI